MLVSGRPLPPPARGAVVVMTDITGQHKDQAELRRSNRQLEAPACGTNRCSTRPATPTRWSPNSSTILPCKIDETGATIGFESLPPRV